MRRRYRFKGGASRAQRRARVQRLRKMKGFPQPRNPRTGGFLGIELKFLDTAWNGVLIAGSTTGADGEMQPSTGCTNAISVPAQGVGESQRIGRKYTIKSFWLSGLVDTTASTGVAAASEALGTYCALVLDKQANGATIVSENVYINPSTSAGAMMPQPLRNLQNSKRFRILASRYYRPGGLVSMNDTATTASFNQQVATKVNLGWHGSIVVECDAVEADVASVTDNAIHLVCFSGGGLVKNFIGKCRMRFVG